MSDEKRGWKLSRATAWSIATLGIALLAGLLAGAIVWIVLAEPALFVVWGISFPFAAALCFLLRGTADILSRERRKYGILSACGRLISVVLALGLSFLYIYLVKGTSYLYLLASPTAIAFGYLAGMIGAWKEEKS